MSTLLHHNETHNSLPSPGRLLSREISPLLEEVAHNQRAQIDQSTSMDNVGKPQRPNSVRVATYSARRIPSTDKARHRCLKVPYTTERANYALLPCQHSVHLGHPYQLTSTGKTVFVRCDARRKVLHHPTMTHDEVIHAGDKLFQL